MGNINKVLEIDDKGFDKTIAKGVTLIDFWAEWCMPCKMQGPILERVAKKLGDKANICKLNVDENPLTPTKYNISSIPSLFIFKDGVIAKTFVGVQSEELLTKTIENLL